jgi:hypothetical protein
MGGIFMSQSERLCVSAGVLLLISAVTHVAQIFVYGTGAHVLGAAGFGVIYFFIGLFLVMRKRWALWLGVILPPIGGVLGILRFIFRQSTPFIIFHVLVDVVVIIICIYLLAKHHQEKKAQEGF